MAIRTRLSEASGRGGAAVTPSDATVLSPASRGVYVGGTGDLTVRMAGDASVLTFVGVPGGTLLPIAVDQVRAATTATDIVIIR